MLKRDTRAKFVQVGVFSKKYRVWTPSTMYATPTISADNYNGLLAAQMQAPVLLMKNDSERRQLWMFHNDFFWDDEGLTSTDVGALLLDKERKRRRQIDRAKAAAQQQPVPQADSHYRQPIPDDVKMFVWQRDKGRCIKCGSQAKLEFDHIIPVSMGGSNTARNIQLLCETCNRAKGAALG